MRLVIASLVFFVLVLLPQVATPHDPSFWLALRADAFRMPQSEAVLPLAMEAAIMLGSTDPQIRDAVAYEALAAWIHTDKHLNAREISRLLEALVPNARRGLGDAQGRGLLLRSFSTLALSVVATEDLRQPFLTETQFNALVGLAIDQLAKERGLRGYIVGKGWGHATAHSADLVRFLCRSERLTVTQQGRIVESVSARLSSAAQVFVRGEDPRLAACPCGAGGTCRRRPGSLFYLDCAPCQGGRRSLAGTIRSKAVHCSSRAALHDE